MVLHDARFRPSTDGPLSLGASPGTLSFEYQDASGLTARKSFHFQPDGHAYMLNVALENRPKDMRITMHVCRGNFRSTFVAAGKSFETRHVPGNDNRARLVGNPVREAVRALRSSPYRAPSGDRVIDILVFGGSQGAKAINSAVIAPVTPNGASSA